jgi:hypothetical protein
MPDAGTAHAQWHKLVVGGGSGKQCSVSGAGTARLHCDRGHGIGCNIQGVACERLHRRKGGRSSRKVYVTVAARRNLPPRAMVIAA